MDINDFYSIGSYYETSDNTFNPNVSFGGTWELCSDESVLISESSEHSIGSTGGSNRVTLQAANLPAHSHKASTSVIKSGSGTGTWGDGTITTGWARPYNYKAGDAASYGPSSLTTQTTGSTQAHNNMQPYIYVKRWKRVA